MLLESNNLNSGTDKPPERSHTRGSAEQGVGSCCLPETESLQQRRHYMLTSPYADVTPCLRHSHMPPSAHLSHDIEGSASTVEERLVACMSQGKHSQQPTFEDKTHRVVPGLPSRPFLHLFDFSSSAWGVPCFCVWRLLRNQL